MRIYSLNGEQWLMRQAGQERWRQATVPGSVYADLMRDGTLPDPFYRENELEAFALFAIATSFLGAGLGLFDYMADLCGFDNSRLGRTKTMLITFVPPMIGGIIWPDGFLPAIGWAGLAASIWSVIVPALLLRASRRKFQASLYRVPGGSTTVPLLLVYGIIVAVCHTLNVFNLLPVFK